jgi:hypothetical protein
MPIHLGLNMGYMAFWREQENRSLLQTQSYTISLIQNVTDPPSSQIFTTSNTSIAISNMYCNWKGFYVKANCANGNSGDWAGPFIF